jgi:hypothetical protein
MQYPNDVIINLTDLIGSQSLIFSISDITTQKSSYFIATIAILDSFNGYSGVVVHVKMTAKQLANLLTNSLQKIPLTAELFEGSILVSQLVSVVAK